MLEVHPNLFVGSQSDYESNVPSFTEWAVIHACKEPYHRQALGYSGRAVSKTHPEYLIAKRPNRLIVNLIDADDPTYIPDEIMDACLAFIHDSLDAKQHVLVHCNQGLSRSLAIAMLYLGSHTEKLPKTSFEEAIILFRQIYPPFSPKGGVYGFLRNRWELWSTKT
jgi:hypothetical protein